MRDLLPSRQIVEVFGLDHLLNLLTQVRDSRISLVFADVVEHAVEYIRKQSDMVHIFGIGVKNAYILSQLLVFPLYALIVSDNAKKFIYLLLELCREVVVLEWPTYIAVRVILLAIHVLLSIATLVLVVGLRVLVLRESLLLAEMSCWLLAELTLG